MKCILTTLLLLFIANSLAAQRKSANKTQSFLSIETGIPIVAASFQTFPIPLTIEYQRQKKRWAVGAGLGLEYDRNTYGDCSKRIPAGTPLRLLGNYSYPYLPYCENSQSLSLKPSIFGAYYFFQKSKVQLFTKLGGLANVPIFYNKQGEYYEIEAIVNGGRANQVVDTGPISLRNYDYFQQKALTRFALWYGLGGQYALNKKAALRFSLQSEWYSDYLNKAIQSSSLVSVLGGLMIKI